MKKGITHRQHGCYDNIPIREGLTMFCWTQWFLRTGSYQIICSRKTVAKTNSLGIPQFHFKKLFFLLVLKYYLTLDVRHTTLPVHIVEHIMLSHCIQSLWMTLSRPLGIIFHYFFKSFSATLIFCFSKLGVGNEAPSLKLFLCKNR